MTTDIMHMQKAVPVLLQQETCRKKLIYNVMIETVRGLLLAQIL